MATARRVTTTTDDNDGDSNGDCDGDGAMDSGATGYDDDDNDDGNGVTQRATKSTMIAMARHATTTTTMATTTMMATARRKGDDPMEGRPSTILWRYLLTKIASTLDRVFINSGIFFIHKVMLPPTTMSDPPPLPCSSDSQMVSDGFSI